MRGNDVPASLRTRVREYYRYLWRSRKGWDVTSILADLPPKLRVEIGLCLNAEIIEKVPMLKGAEPRLLEELVLELQPRVVIPGEEIFRAGEPGDAMYFIQRRNRDRRHRRHGARDARAGSFFAICDDDLDGLAGVRRDLGASLCS